MTAACHSERSLSFRSSVSSLFPLPSSLLLSSTRARVAATLLSAIALHPVAAQQPRADLLLVNGRVLTVDSADRIAQAVAIAGNRIVAVGSTAEIERTAAPNARRIDLRGRTVTPGLLDAHAHFSGGGADRLYVLDLSYPNVKNIADVAEAVRAKVAAAPHGAWIQGRGWDEGKLAERRVITAKDLDAVSPENPVVLTQTTGHYVVANSVALRLAGITKETRDPPNGTIDRNPDGTPTGLLREGAAGLVRRLTPSRSAAETDAGIRDFVKAFNAEGMTGLKDPGISTETWNIYKKVEQDSALNVRVFVLWSGGRSVEAAKRVIAEHAATTKPYESTGDDHLVAGGVKLYVDGSGGARTAWLYEDWNKNYRDVDTGNRGYPASNADTRRM
jgi:predicted amidohydrolase YtcJ